MDKHARVLAQFAALSFMLAAGAVVLDKLQAGGTALWLAGGFGAVFLAQQRPARDLSLLAAAGAAHLLAHLLAGDTFAYAALRLPGHLAEAWCGALALRALGPAVQFDQGALQYLRVLAVACLLPPLAGAGIGAALLALSGQPLLATAVHLYSGSVVGAIAIVPLAVLSLRPRPDGGALIGAPRAAALALSMSLLCAVAPSWLPFPFVLVMVALMGVALLTNPACTALAGLVAVVVLTAIEGSGLMMPQALRLWAYSSIYVPLAAILVPSMLLAISVQQGKQKEAQRKQFEIGLEQSHRELQTIINHMPAMIGYWDRNLRNRFGNQAYQEWFGLDPERMRGMHIREVVGEERYALNQPYLAGALAGQHQMFERTIIDQHGATRYTLASYVPDIDAHGVQGFYAFITDVTPMFLAKRQLAEAQDRLQGIIDSASEFSIIATDADGVIRTFSTGAERMLGYAAHEVVGIHKPLLFHLAGEVAAHGARISLALGRKVEGQEALTARADLGLADAAEWTYVRKDGSELPVHLVVSAMRNGDGAPIGYLGIAHDISSQRQMQATLVAAKEQAEAASRAKSEFVANMSHEIRTPLNAVLGMAQLLGTTPLAPAQAKYLEMIRRSGESLLGIVNDVLDFSKNEAGRMELSPVPFRLHDLLGALASIMTVNAGEKDLELAIGIGPGIPDTLIGDALRLQQVLVNLAANAIKFTEQGEVSVLVERAGEITAGTVTLVFCVRDTGIGIDEAKQARLFAAFAQADSSTTRRFGGTGLGLVISRQLAELMGGAIEVRSKAGEGSEFRLTVALGVSQQSAAERPGARALGPLRLLVVDDNSTSRDYVCRTIETWQWRADAAGSGHEALLMLLSAQQAGQRYDAVLADWRMPGMDGLALMAAVHELPGCETLPVAMMVSAFGHGQLMRQSGAERADAVLIKPLTASSLFDGLHGMVTRKGAATPGESFAAGLPPGMRRLDGVRVLLVEDNALNQIVARGMLEMSGAVVDIAVNGKEALAQLGAGKSYELVLMDVQMPVMDGFAATRAIRSELGLTLPVIAMTAGVMAAEQAQCMASGMDDFIAKPIDVGQMFSAICRHVVCGVPLGAPVPQASEQVAKLDQLLAMGRGNEQASAELVAIIRAAIARGPGDVDKACAAWDAGRALDAAALLHTLRGSLGSFGTPGFAATVHAAEKAIRAGSVDQVPDLLQAVRLAMDAMARDTSRWLDARPPAA